ncbi:zinc finger CCHC domain-containing protein 8 homolog [Halyomorpha halys]|uniref:zinc finger CCHC domain-containing protein 8 homolog n=1 Tax=Halyomorpha halys TaxID=286706 RepID=UPI0006D5055D|nr:zinc finger CCHC domain-containing protein 8 homolog [Halyomorpha halys]
MEKDSQLFQISVVPDAEDVRVPMYNVGHVYDINSNPDDEEKPKPVRVSKSACWNCGGDGHSIRDCKLPHDGRRISQNKAKFASRFEFKRYHVDSKKKIYPHLVPGEISDKLRGALGVRKDQLPPYIYRMRSLGYPPGWLLNAKSDYSGIEMFDSEGNRIPNADEEEGEIGIPAERISYDESKIITYPGFNAWPEPGCIDEAMKYGAPEMSIYQSKEEFIKSLKHLTSAVSYNTGMMWKDKVVKLGGEADMETEETDDIHLLPDDNKCAFIPPLPDECQPPPPPPGDDDFENSTEGPDSEKADVSTSDEKSSVKDDSLSLLNASMDTPGSTHGKIKFIDYGTPVLKIHSPYSKLPPPEAFKKDISDVINFENLPDSTGAYEKLKGVLKSARTKMSLIRENKMNNSI